MDSSEVAKMHFELPRFSFIDGFSIHIIINYPSLMIIALATLEKEKILFLYGMDFLKTMDKVHIIV